MQPRARSFRDGGSAGEPPTANDHVASSHVPTSDDRGLDPATVETALYLLSMRTTPRPAVERARQLLADVGHLP